jgi:hypothetical protein
MRKGIALVLAAVSLGSPAQADAPDPSVQARTALAIMQGDAASVRQLLLEARLRRAPPPQVLCVDSALTRADVALRTSRDLYADMRAAIALGARERAGTVLLSIFAYRESARSAARDASACVSPIVRPPSETTSVHVVVERSLPPDAAIFR